MYSQIHLHLIRFRSVSTFQFKTGTWIILVHPHSKCSQWKQIDTITIFYNIQVSISGADTDHICNAAQLSGRCPHPYNIMVSPLDINRMIFQQLIHNKMRSRSSVINITDNMQMIHNQTLDQF